MGIHQVGEGSGIIEVHPGHGAAPAEDRQLGWGGQARLCSSQRRAKRVLQQLADSLTTTSGISFGSTIEIVVDSHGRAHVGILASGRYIYASVTFATDSTTCEIACYDAYVPRTVQIRDIDDDVYEALARRASELGMSVPELLRRETERLAARPTVDEWLDRTRRRSGERTRRETLEALDELRGPWPS